MPAAHLRPVGENERDFVAVAERFLGVPYLWGGKTALGLDCSGLVQIALTACGVACPRDSDMQEKALGKSVAAGADHSGLERGDLVFWKGHVAIVRDARPSFTPTPFTWRSRSSRLPTPIARIRAAGSDITGVRRI